ncbi:MAG: hypothetical protein ACRERR_14750 [Moraxellaceae bacterium]
MTDNSIKAFLMLSLAVLLSGGIGLYAPGKEEIPVCSKPNCQVQINGKGLIVSSSSKKPVPEGFAQFSTSETTKAETIGKIGSPNKVMPLEGGGETWLYTKNKSLHMYLISAIFIPIPVPLPYRDTYYYKLNFNGEKLDYFGYEKDTLSPIGPCYVLFWGKC